MDCQGGRLRTQPARARRCVKLLLSAAISGSQEVERTLGIIHGTVLISLLQLGGRMVIKIFMGSD